MQIRFILTADGVEHELGPDCVKNWDDIKCSWKRKDLGGVVRSFTSKFEFVNAAYDILLAQFQHYETEACVTIGMLAMNNRWTWDKVYESPLDFSTYQEERGCIKVNAADNSMAALIKANKSTKYEYVVGTDIVPDRTFCFDRVQIQEYAKYTISGGTSNDDGSITVSWNVMPSGVVIGETGNEVYVGRHMYFKDDVTFGSGDFILRAEKKTDVTLTANIRYDSGNTYVNGGRRDFVFGVRHRGGSVTDYEVLRIGGINRCKEFASVDELPEYVMTVGNVSEDFSWVYPPSTMPDARHYARVGDDVYLMQLGEERYDIDDNGYPVSGYYVSWVLLDETYESLFVSESACVHTISMQEGDTLCLYGDFFDRNGFSWMPYVQGLKVLGSSIVFSWTARGEAVQIPAFSPAAVAGRILESMVGRPVDVVVDDTDERLADTVIAAAESIRGLPVARLYTSFNEFCDWMEAVFGYCHSLTQDGVSFVHRSGIFRPDAPLKSVDVVNDVVYSVDSSMLYASVSIGCNKKDYDSINGRDEFNFSNEYATGSTVSDKQLKLVSAYRADCYGMEFAAEKRGKDTTDSDSDKDVFFVLVDSQGRPDRSVAVDGALSDTVFNARFSPLACVRANAGYIGAQAERLCLAFASSTGNSDIVIGGEPMSADIPLCGRLVTAGQLSFSTNDLDLPDDPDCLVKVTDSGISYTGYISELDVRLGRQQSAKYKLIVKSRTIEQ